MYSIKEYLELFDQGFWASPDTTTQINAGWHEWVCKETELKSKTYNLTNKIKTLLPSTKIDIEHFGLFFENEFNPVTGNKKTFDYVAIFDVVLKEPIWVIAPKIDVTDDEGNLIKENLVFHNKNNFRKPIFSAKKWDVVKRFFKT